MYIKLVIIIRYLWIIEECYASGMRRIDMFLRHPSVPGESALAQNYFAYMEENSVDMGADMIRSQVLAGDFLPMLADDDDENEMPPTEAPPMVEDDDTKTRGLKANDAFSTALEKLPPALQEIVNYYRKQFGDEMKSMMNMTREAEPREKIATQLSCNSKKEDCLALEEFGVRCMIDCLTRNSHMVNKYSGHIARILHSFCDPIGTEFADVYESMEKDSQGSRTESYLKAIKANREQILPAVTMGANSLTYLMVTGVATSLLPMGIICEEMKGLLANKPAPAPAPMEVKDTTIPGVPNNNNSAVPYKPKFGNPLCTPKLIVDETFQMAQVFEREPSLLDVTLPGFNTIATMVKYVPGEHQNFYCGFLESFEIMTGISCGLINHVEGGQPSNCNQIGGFPRPGVIMPLSVRRSVPNWDTFCKGPQAHPLQGSTGPGGPAAPHKDPMANTPGPTTPLNNIPESTMPTNAPRPARGIMTDEEAPIAPEGMDPGMEPMPPGAPAIPGKPKSIRGKRQHHG